MNIRIEPGTVNIYDNQLNGNEIEFVAVVGSKDVSYSDGYSPVGFVPEVSPGTTYCEIVLGTQIWMCYNYASAYPGSKVYNDNEANRDLYGGLYTFDQINNPGFCPTGWHVPTLAEWQTAIDFCGGDAVAGGILKSAGFTYWLAPNTGAVDTYGFGARGGGIYNIYIPGFDTLNRYGRYWTADEYNASLAYNIMFQYDSAALIQTGLDKNHFASVRLIKDTPAPPVIYNDWFLPSLNTLDAMYNNLHSFGVGGFVNDLYWSSSELNLSSAWFIDFTTDMINAIAKFNTYHVRACRSFVDIIGAYALRDVGPAGGWIFYIDGAGTTYFEAAHSDQSIGYIWSNIINVLIGTTSIAIGEGQNNTNEIIAQPGHINSAAKLCDDLLL
jgi:uncharacterized protein (TIGR02145 family)